MKSPSPQVFKNKTAEKQQLIDFPKSTKMSAYERYEATKRKNFIHSSRLEGIEIPSQKSKQSLESILAKYRV